MASKSDPAGTLKAKDLDGDKTSVQVDSNVVPAQDPPRNPPQAKKNEIKNSEANPDRSPALPKDDEKLVLSNPAEPSRADTVLKDAGAWPTEAHKATTRVAFVDDDSTGDGIHPEQSPPPQEPARTTTVVIEGVPEGANVRTQK